jgi:formate hydrogenlyase subunit 3/multisubunit Na+/H+ antiporter MnhD subunit
LSTLEYLDEITYETKINNQENRNLFSSFNLTLSYELFKSTSASFTVYYPSLQYEQISESPKTQIIDLFTQVGGALGMFVSFSIFTLFEFMEIFLLILKDLITKSKNQISNLQA